MNIERKLVTIRTINNIEPIKDSDNIEVITVDGWKVVSKKNEFKIGDKCIYFEIDSFLPANDSRFEFLRKSSYKKMADGSEGFRLKTIRLRGQISQGLALPVSLFPELETSDDYDKTLNVIKFEGPVLLSTEDALGRFPSFIVKTDAERIQNVTSYFSKHEDDEFEISLKLDGTSCTVFLNKDDFGVCSRNLRLKPSTDGKYWTCVNNLDLENRLKNYGRNIAIQGEVMGEGIQGNKEKIKGLKFFVFSIFDIDNYRYFDPDERLDILNELNKTGAYIDHVPILETHTKIFKKYTNVHDLLKYAEGPSLNNNCREGLVFKGYGDNRDIIFKAISNEFLCKE